VAANRGARLEPRAAFAFAFAFAFSF